MGEVLRVALEAIKKQVLHSVKDDQEVEAALEDSGTLLIKLPEYRGLPRLRLFADSRQLTAILLVAIIENEEEERGYSYFYESECKLKHYDLCEPTAIDDAANDIVYYVNNGEFPR